MILQNTTQDKFQKKKKKKKNSKNTPEGKISAVSTEEHRQKLHMTFPQKL